MKKIEILVVEDEPKLAQTISDFLRIQNYEVETALTGNKALEYFCQNKQKVDLILLDLMLPDISGYTVLKEIRKISEVPVIILSARSAVADQMSGFEKGADDYITKPFSLAVLRARVNAQLRRSAPVKPDRIELNGFIFDFAQLEFSKDGTIIDLSKTEQRLLRLLVENRGRTLPRELLLEKVWDGGEFVDENALSVAVRRLRGKLGNAPIRTVYGVGYTWEVSK